jgi:hypothetical protein
LPEPIYWRQNLLTVPYQWRGGANGNSPTSVWLYVSRDRGATWNQISDAQPQILAFNYRAEADGEYWFAIRTLDARGRDLPPGTLPGVTVAPLEPELRVIVDTTMPRFDGLTGTLHHDGTLEARWRVADANLQADSCRVEVQQDQAGDWRPVPLVNAMETTTGVWDGIASIHLAPQQRPTAVRATVVDLAGNRALYQSALTTATATDAKNRFQSHDSTDSSAAIAPPVDVAPGWVSSSAPTAADLAIDRSVQPQLWPADRTASSMRKSSDPDRGPSGLAITYGAPLAPVDVVSGIPTPQTDDQPLGNVPAQQHKTFTSHVPFRQVSTLHAATAAGTDLPTAQPPTSATPVASPAAIKLVNSRTFALEYELAEVGGSGVLKVELWGTRDNGETWRSYAVDDDNRSPLTVTVDGTGEYGFRIAVDGAGGVGGFPPQSGDRPELVVGVDLEPPQSLITTVDVDAHRDPRQLVVHWEAEDDNLVPRPISLFYSSRPAGPWTAIATSLENVGEYDWPLERHVPRQVYLKLEARDMAGNVSAFQTTEPVAIESEPSLARIQRLPPVSDPVRRLP